MITQEPQIPNINPKTAKWFCAKIASLNVLCNETPIRAQE